MKRTLALLWAIAGLAACAPTATRPVAEGLPRVPTVRGPLEIRVVHPTPNTALPRVDSTFVFGSVGDGRASLTINGTEVPVAANGAFLAYLPVPDSGAYRLVAERGRERVEAVAQYRLPPPPRDTATPPARTDTASAPPTATPAAAGPTTGVFAQPRLARVIGGADTLASGSDVAPGSPTPTADRVWQLPRGARLSVVERRGGQLRARLAPGTDAWFADSLLSVDTTAVVPSTAPAGPVSLRSAADYVDIRIPADSAPFLVRPEARSVGITLYGRTAPAGAPDVSTDSLFSSAAWRATGADSVRLELALTRPFWGYKAFYEPDGTLVVRVRRPPRIDPDDPLGGVRIVVDAGHPPGGATGPTGLTEPEANLAISLRLAERLRARGAEVILTRTTDAPLVSATNTTAELRARVEKAVQSDAHLLVSVHNNAFPEGVNPFVNAGTETYYFYPFAADLAEALNREIADVTRIPNLGAKARSLALVRPTWMPATLTESLFMMIPEQEAALRDERFLDRLADAHLRGIEAFLRGRAVSAP